jgi:hypothetical protein
MWRRPRQFISKPCTHAVSNHVAASSWSRADNGSLTLALGHAIRLGQMLIIILQACLFPMVRIVSVRAAGVFP